MASFGTKADQTLKTGATVNRRSFRLCAVSNVHMRHASSLDVCNLVSESRSAKTEPSQPLRRRDTRSLVDYFESSDFLSNPRFTGGVIDQNAHFHHGAITQVQTHEFRRILHHRSSAAKMDTTA